MCGLFAIYDQSQSRTKAKTQLMAKTQLAKLRHRGPDQWKVMQTASGVLSHTRLSIMDPSASAQPFGGPSFCWAHNGEIYNYKQLISSFSLETIDKSDSSILGGLYKKVGESLASKLDGVFALVIFDANKIYAARDPLGVKPLFYGTDEQERLYFSSEMKALQECCTDIKVFPAGHYYSSSTGFVRYYNPVYEKNTAFQFEEVKSKLKSSLESAVEKRLMSDVPLASLLSGGLDSSLVAAIAARKLARDGKKLHTFSIGLESGTLDLKSAKLVSEHIGSIHHEVLFSVEEGISALRDIIYHLETFDVTTIRASTPMYLLSKEIEDKGFKVVLSGEGADEIFGGYLYFNLAPSPLEFHKETLRRVSLLHSADLLRADRSTMAHGLEARVPFLDLEFLEEAMSIDPSLKVINSEHMEKWVLRSAFSDDSLIPDEILWRQKEQFSDGVGYSWVDGLKELAQQKVSDELFDQRFTLYPHLTPTTKEAFLYRMIFSEHFEHSDIEKTVKQWIPKWQENSDPSGRASTVHVATTESSGGVAAPVGGLAGK